MSPSEYDERVAAIRGRFAAKLATQIEQTDADVAIMPSAGRAGGDAVAVVYRRFHNICGIGPAIGFIRAGHAAKAIDNVLAGPFRAERGLTANEMAEFAERLAAFRAAAQDDLQSAGLSEHLT